MKAKPTQYKGILFDSKSEAVFARGLDLATYKWKYHVAHAGHVWDFRVQNEKTTFLVEYKPNMPTRAYVDWLTNSQRKDPVESLIIWGNPWERPDLDFSGNDYCYVPYPIFCKQVMYHYAWGEYEPMAGKAADPDIIIHEGQLCNVLPKLTFAVANEAKKYRFDLQ